VYNVAPVVEVSKGSVKKKREVVAPSAQIK